MLQTAILVCKPNSSFNADTVLLPNHIFVSGILSDIFHLKSTHLLGGAPPNPGGGGPGGNCCPGNGGNPGGGPIDH